MIFSTSSFPFPIPDSNTTTSGSLRVLVVVGNRVARDVTGYDLPPHDPYDFPPPTATVVRAIVELNTERARAARLRAFLASRPKPQTIARAQPRPPHQQPKLRAVR